MPSPLVVIFGGDLLALRVCEELIAAGSRVVVIADPGEDTAAGVTGAGARFVARRSDERLALLAADVGSASVAMALTEDDHPNLQFALAARDLNPAIRLVMRQFNRTLGRKIEESLPNCSVISLSALSAATYAAAALDRDCIYGLQFPYLDGKLVGFTRRSAADAGVVQVGADEAERRLDVRVLTCNGRGAFDRSRPLEPDDELLIFSTIVLRHGAAARSSLSGVAAYVRRVTGLVLRLLRPDPVVRVALVAALLVFAFATTFFALRMKLDALTAAYFVFSTMTTTGYGDITPPRDDGAAKIGAMVLMLGGLTFSGIFIAVLSSRFTQAQYIATQGLRRVSLRDHIVVCGAGNVGSRVIEYLENVDIRVVVVETHPRQDLVERARDGEFRLLTGDASRERTLDLCNVSEAAAVIALTNSDTMNLEVGLVARARNKAAHVVMRVQHGHFEESIRKQFGFDRVFGTAALAAPVFAGLAFDPGMRGQLALPSGAFAVAELVVPRGSAGVLGHEYVPLAVWRDGAVVPLRDVANAVPGETVLVLVPAR